MPLAAPAHEPAVFRPQAFQSSPIARALAAFSMSVTPQKSTISAADELTTDETPEKVPMQLVDNEPGGDTACDTTEVDEDSDDGEEDEVAEKPLQELSDVMVVEGRE